MAILGLHHISLISADAERSIYFYTGLLGMRLVKRTVNFDDPYSNHIYFSNEQGTPGAIVTCFEWYGVAKGRPGIGGAHHFAFQTTSRETLLKWKRRLTDAGLPVEGPLDRLYFTSIYFNDPDGTILEIATIGPGWAIDEDPDAIGTEFREPPTEMLIRNRDEERIAAETWPEPVPDITPDMALRQGLHHITVIGVDIQRTQAFFGDLLGMRRVKMTNNFDDPNSAHWYWGAGDGRPGTLITYFERNPRNEPRRHEGAGQTHHFALAVADEETQLAWREKLVREGLRVTPVMDRVYYKSIYTTDPDGAIVELATVGPGFTVDEPPDDMGRSLQLPPWLESARSDINAALRPLVAPAWRPMEAEV